MVTTSIHPCVGRHLTTCFEELVGQILMLSSPGALEDNTGHYLEQTQPSSSKTLKYSPCTPQNDWPSYLSSPISWGAEDPGADS